MVLVKNRVKYFYYILSIKAAYCNPFCKRFIRGSYFCKRFIRGSYIYYSKIFWASQADFDYFLINFSFLICVFAGAFAGFFAPRWIAGTGRDISSFSQIVAFCLMV